MKARRMPADAARPVKDWLIIELAAREPGVTVGLSLPKDWQPGHPPAVVVRGDSGPLDEWPVYSQDQVGVTVWADGRTEARRIAGLCLGLLLCHRVPGVGVRPGTNLLDAKDEHNNGFMAGFTVRTRVRTTTF